MSDRAALLAVATLTEVLIFLVIGIYKLIQWLA
jgi:hypothetical protein